MGTAGQLFIKLPARVQAPVSFKKQLFHLSGVPTAHQDVHAPLETLHLQMCQDHRTWRETIIALRLCVECDVSRGVILFFRNSCATFAQGLLYTN